MRELLALGIVWDKPGKDALLYQALLHKKFECCSLLLMRGYSMNEDEEELMQKSLFAFDVLNREPRLHLELKRLTM